MSKSNRISMAREDYGNGLCRLAGRLHERRDWRKDQIDFGADHQRREFRELINSIRPLVLDDEVLALDVPQLMQARPQRLDAVRKRRRRPQPEKSDPGRLRPFLPPGDASPRRRNAAKEAEDMPALHGGPPRVLRSADVTCGRVGDQGVL